VNETGSALVYTLLLGGSRVNDARSDFASAIAVDNAGNAYVTGQTNSADFPTTAGAFQTAYTGSADAFIAKIADRPAGIMAVFESPDNGPVSGISVIRGWAVATEAGVALSSVELFIDGQSAGEVPCCSQRADVQAAFPQFPADNTRNSGWGTVFNWGLVSPGTHTVRLFIRSTTGELLVTDTRTVTVVKPGDSEYLDRFDLSQATATLQDEELTVDGILVRDKATQQQKRINARFRWFESSQSLGMVEATTVAEITSLRSFFAPLFTSLSSWFRGGPGVAAARDLPQIASSFESPEQEQVVSGIGIIRGWAFDETGGPIRAIGLVLDGQWSDTIPCCSERADVAAAYPDQPAALHSGWGTVFNYGLLGAGPHTIGVTAEYWSYVKVLGTQAVTVVRPGGFEFLDQFDLSHATARIVRIHPWSLPDGEEVRFEGVKVRDKASQQEKVITVQLRWFVSSQALGLVSSSD